MSRDDDLNEKCIGCGQKRRAHGGKNFEGKCPGQAGLTGSRFRLSLRISTYVRPRKNPLPGGGPWRIREDCPSPRLHNTGHAAQRPNGGCVCPRALAEKWRIQDRNNSLKAVRRADRGAKPRDRKPEYQKSSKLANLIRRPQQTSIPTPNLRGGMCSLPTLRQQVDGGFSTEATAAGMRRREAAKAVCNSCPLRDKVCGPYVLAAEVPAGSWGGVWGGMDPWERMGLEVFMTTEGEVDIREREPKTASI